MRIEHLIEVISKQWWTGYILLVLYLFLILMANWALSKFFGRLDTWSQGLSRQGLHIFVYSLRKPFRYGLISIAFLSIFLFFVFDRIAGVRAFITLTIKAVVLLSATWCILRMTGCVEQSCKDSGKGVWQLDQHSLRGICKLIRIAVIVAAILILLDTAGIKITALLAFGGFGGIVLGFAARDVLSNIFGGLMLFLDRPFAEGEWIRSPDRKIEGTVAKIGWRTTIIETFSSTPIYVPNSIFSTICLENPSRMKNRRFKEIFSISYADMQKTDAVVADINFFLKKDRRLDHSRVYFAQVVNFGDSSVDIQVYTFTKTTDWLLYQEQKQGIMLDIAKIIGKHGATIPFPSRTLYIEKLEKTITA